MQKSNSWGFTGFKPSDYTYKGVPLNAAALAEILGLNNSNGPDSFKPWLMRGSVLKVLQSKNDCSSWFNTAMGSASDVMSQVPILLGNPTSGNGSGPDASTNQGPTGAITVAPDERFYPIQYSKNGRSVGDVCDYVNGGCTGGFAPGSYGARMIILLHELAHKMYLIPPDGPLAEGPSDQSDRNTSTVMKHCQETVSSGH